MKHFFLKISLIFIFFLMLIRPQEVFQGACSGLLLWFQTVLPTLLPFILISNLLIKTNAFSLLTFCFGPALTRLLGTSLPGSFAVLTGFLCGYPMGAKTTADLIHSGHITRQEGAYLLSFCNNTSLGFIMNYIIFHTLGRKDLLIPAVIILTSSPLLASIPFRLYYLHKYHLRSFTESTAASEQALLHFDFHMLDDCIMDSFEAITYIGGYIMIFSIFTALLSILPCQIIRNAFLPALEITNGVLLLSRTLPDIKLLFPAVCALSSFGGICAAAQTSCMIHGTGLRLFPYITEKLITALVTSLLCVLYLHQFV